MRFPVGCVVFSCPPPQVICAVIGPVPVDVTYLVRCRGSRWEVVFCDKGVNEKPLSATVRKCDTNAGIAVRVQILCKLTDPVAPPSSVSENATFAIHFVSGRKCTLEFAHTQISFSTMIIFLFSTLPQYSHVRCSPCRSQLCAASPWIAQTPFRMYSPQNVSVTSTQL